VPLRRPMTRAGQHQAPRRAGMEIMSMMIEMKIPFLSPASSSGFFASSPAAAGFNSSFLSKISELFSDLVSELAMRFWADSRSETPPVAGPHAPLSHVLSLI